MFNCLKCSKNYEKEFDKDIQIHMNSVMKTLANFVSCSEKESIHKNILIHGKGLMEHNCMKRKIFTVT